VGRGRAAGIVVALSDVSSEGESVRAQFGAGGRARKRGASKRRRIGP